MAPSVCRKTHEDLFFEIVPKRSLLSVCEKKLWTEVAQKRFGQVWGNSGKNPSHPKKLPAPAPMESVLSR